MSHSFSLSFLSLSSSSHPSLLYLRAVFQVAFTYIGHCILYLSAIFVAAHSTRIILSPSLAVTTNMDNDPEPVQSQKKEKALNEYEVQKVMVHIFIANRYRLLTSRIADIYVGPDSSHWPIHERLLCYHSPFLSKVFYKDDEDKGESSNKPSSRNNKSYGFPDEEEHTFTLLVGWLYSRVVAPPKTEKEIGPLLDLYLLAQKLEIEKLSTDVVDATREFYHTSSTYPGLRRVQYIYANTDEDNEMREMMVSSVARQLTTTEKVPAHWASALQRNGQLAVDIIRAIQRWNIEEKSIPDIRDGSISGSRGRKGKGGFSAIDREGDSVETTTTGMTGSLSLGSNLGVESVASEETGHEDEKMAHSVSSIGKTTEGEA